MNKDKIIKDLKKRNDSLKMQYEYRNIRCIHLERENERLREENQQLKKQKDDVVEFIKNIARTDDYLDGISCDDLLRMLGETEELSND